MKTTVQNTSPELQHVADKCSVILDSIQSNAQNISVLYRDKVGNVLTIIVPSDEEILAKLPEGGTYFIGII